MPPSMSDKKLVKFDETEEKLANNLLTTLQMIRKVRSNELETWEFVNLDVEDEKYEHSFCIINDGLTILY